MALTLGVPSLRDEMLVASNRVATLPMSLWLIPSLAPPGHPLPKERVSYFYTEGYPWV